MTRWPHYILATLMAAFASSLSWFTVTAFHKLNIHRFDLGNVEQVMWNLVHGRGFVMTDPYGTAEMTRFAFHADPFLIFLAPFYAIWPHAETLIVLQVVALTAAIPATFLLGRRVVGSIAAGLAFAVATTISAPLLWSGIQPLHAVTFAVPLILWGGYFALQKKYVAAAILLGLAMLTKEQVGLSVAMFGAFLWWRRRDWRWGPWLTVIPAVYALTMFFVVLPALAPTTTAYQSAYGETASSVVSHVLRQPVEAVKDVIGPANVKPVMQLVASFGGLALFSPISLAALPDIVINGLSDKIQQRDIRFHYHGSLLPWLIIGAAFGWSWFAGRMKRYSPRAKHLLLCGWLIGSAAVISFQYGPLPGTPNSWLRFATWGNRYAPIVREYAATLPPETAVSVTNNVGAQFAGRAELYSFPYGLDRADVVVVWRNHGQTVVSTEAENAAALELLRRSPEWRIVRDDSDLTILARQVAETNGAR